MAHFEFLMASSLAEGLIPSKLRASSERSRSGEEPALEDLATTLYARGDPSARWQKRGLFGMTSRERTCVADFALYCVRLLFREIADYGQLVHLSLIRFDEQDDPGNKNSDA